MDIKKLLKSSKISWDGGVESLEKDFDEIIDLLCSLPEPKNNEIKYKKFSVLSKDQEDKEAKKEDILEGDMFKI